MCTSVLPQEYIFDIHNICHLQKFQIRYLNLIWGINVTGLLSDGLNFAFFCIGVMEGPGAGGFFFLEACNWILDCSGVLGFFLLEA